MACIDMLIWVGQPKKKTVVEEEVKGVFKPVRKPSRYQDFSGYINEAIEMGCCRRVPRMPKWIELGKSRVFLVHKGKHTEDELGTIFGYFIVERVECIKLVEGSIGTTPAHDKVVSSEEYFNELKQDMEQFLKKAPDEKSIRQKVRANLKRYLRRDIRIEHTIKVKYTRTYTKHDKDENDEKLLKILIEFLNHYLKDTEKPITQDKLTYIPVEVASGGGGLACSKRYIPGAVYLVNEYWATIMDIYQKKFYNWLENEGPKKYKNYTRERLLKMRYDTEKSRKEFYPEEGIDLYRDAKAAVLKMTRKPSNLILLEEPCPTFEHSPVAAFRGYRRIDGEKLMKQYEKGTKQITLDMIVCSDEQANP